MTKALIIKNLYFMYEKDFVLKDINLTLEDKKFLIIIGPNGGGKTTLLRLILGLLKPFRGEILIYNKSPYKASNFIGYVPQYTNFSLNIPISVFDIVLEGRLKAFTFFYSKEDKEKTIKTLKKIKIEHLKNKRIKELSGGERQKVLIARALNSNPKIIIMDEPTSAIDPQGQKEILDLIESLDITRVVVSHDLKILLRKVDKIAYVNKRLILHEGPKLNIPTDEHFCEVELINFLREINVGVS